MARVLLEQTLLDSSDAPIVQHIKIKAAANPPHGMNTSNPDGARKSTDAAQDKNVNPSAVQIGNDQVALWWGYCAMDAKGFHTTCRETCLDQFVNVLI